MMQEMNLFGNKPEVSTTAELVVDNQGKVKLPIRTEQSVLESIISELLNGCNDSNTTASLGVLGLDFPFSEEHPIILYPGVNYTPTFKVSELVYKNRDFIFISDVPSHTLNYSGITSIQKYEYEHCTLYAFKGMMSSDVTCALIEKSK